MMVINASILGRRINELGKEEVTWGFLLVDMKKCQGCISCMLACSLVHHGVENPSLSRIQILQNPYGCWPDDLTIAQCRQCVDPACVAACTVGALAPDPQFGNVTRVDQEKCIGCKRCISACPYTPSRPVWNFEDGYSQKCDLCAHAPHWYWDESGGPEGKKACVEVCPLGAITYTKVVPDQTREDSYSVNLRGLQWARLGYPGWDLPLLDRWLAEKDKGGIR
ncbi:MAG: 4Fe-4S dicluster domain-containing protein [Desulfobacterota bacterium]|nr:4Fe-4S dicluster domain-containing protein [Thermodesulfobacteriota bacterium]